MDDFPIPTDSTSMDNLDLSHSLAQEQEEAMLIKDADLMLRYLKSHRGPEPTDQLTSSFEDIG